MPAPARTAFLAAARPAARRALPRPQAYRRAGYNTAAQVRPVQPCLAP